MTTPLEFDTARKNTASYKTARPDLIDLVPHSTQTFLDVGCNQGAVAAYLRNTLPNLRRVVGMEINAAALEVARPHLDAAHCLNLEDHAALRAALHGETFDTILAADVLEHLANPWAVSAILGEHLADGGQLIISVPNIAHWEIFLHLLRQSFPLRERGIFDNTHLRFFMRRDVRRLAPPNTHAVIARRLFRLFERRGRRWDVLLKWTLGRVPWLREYFVFQYVVVAKRA